MPALLGYRTVRLVYPADRAESYIEEVINMEKNFVPSAVGNMAGDDEKLVSSGDVAMTIGTSKSYVYSLERKGLLCPVGRFPTGKRLYRVGDVRAFIRGIETGSVGNIKNGYKKEGAF